MQVQFLHSLSTGVFCYDDIHLTPLTTSVLKYYSSNTSARIFIIIRILCSMAYKYVLSFTQRLTLHLYSNNVNRMIMAISFCEMRLACCQFTTVLSHNSQMFTFLLIMITKVICAVTLLERS